MKKILFTLVLICVGICQANAIYFDDDSTIEQGYRGFVEWDYTLGVGQGNKIDRISILTSHGCQIAPQFFVGAGVGLNYYYDNKACGLPLYAHLRSDILNNEISPYVDLKIGYSLVDCKGVYLNPSIGCRFTLSDNMGLNVGIGYTMQKGDTYDYYYIYENANIGGLNFRIGLDF